MSILPPSYKQLGILGGDKYIQHIPDDVEKAQSEFLKVCSEVLKSDVYTKGKIHRQGIIGRYLDDCGVNILNTTWNRFMMNYIESGSNHIMLLISKSIMKKIQSV